MHRLLVAFKKRGAARANAEEKQALWKLENRRGKERGPVHKSALLEYGGAPGKPDLSKDDSTLSFASYQNSQHECQLPPAESPFARVWCFVLHGAMRRAQRALAS